MRAFRLRQGDDHHLAAGGLDGVRESDPLAARLVDDALSALASQGAALGRPLVVPLDTVWDVVEALDQWYQDKLGRLQDVRRTLADAEQAESAPQMHELRERRDRMQRDTDAFRVRKESVKHGYLAAKVADRVAEVAELFGEPIAEYDTAGEWSTFRVLRPTCIANREVRIVFVLEPRNTAVLLYGDMSEQDQQPWYSAAVPEALRRYRRHTDERIDSALS